jgi:hypothetical protein
MTPDQSANADGDRQDHGPGGISPSLKYLLGGAAALQVILTTLGVNNGGVTSMVINHRPSILCGFGLVLVAIAIGAVIMARQNDESQGLIIVGTVVLFVGIGITAYTALVAPAIARAPSINIALSRSSGQLVLTAHIKEGGIPDSSQYWIEIDAREYVPGASPGKKADGMYVALGTPLYQTQIGADSQGNIDDIVSIPLLSDNYSVVSVEAWSGHHAGPCGSLEVPGGANLTQAPNTTESNLEKYSRAGCAVLRLPINLDAHEKPHRKRQKCKHHPKHHGHLL